MPSEMLDWVHAQLERDEDIVVPIKKMWNDWRSQSWRETHGTPALQDFTAAILSDERLEEMPGVDHGHGMEWMSPDELKEYMQDMESLGFYSGPRVKLKSREITLEHIAKMIKKHNDRMEDALRQAREAMPEDTPEQEEGALIDIQVMVEKLRQELRQAGLEPPEDAQDEKHD